MSRSLQITVYTLALLLVAVFAYLMTGSYFLSTTQYALLLIAVMVGILVFIRPIWGMYLVLLLSPLQTLGEEILLATRLVGMLTVAVVFTRIVIQRKPIRWSGIEGPVILMASGIALSFFRSPSLLPVTISLLSLVSLYGMLLLIVNLVEDEDSLKKMSLVFFLSGIIPIGLAIYQWSLGPSPERTYTRVSGSFLLPTGLGGFLIPFTILTLALIFYPGLSRIARLFLIFIFASGMVALTLTLTGGAILGALLGIGLVFVLLWPEIPNNRKVPLMILMILMLAATIYNQWPSIEGRLVKPMVQFIVSRESTATILARSSEMNLIIQAAFDTKFMGTGIGNYTPLAYHYRIIFNAPEIPLTPHNILLYFFGEAGIVSALGFLWLLFWLFASMRQNIRKIFSIAPNITYYIYIGAIAGLIGYLPFLFTHSGLFTNEIWIVMAFFIVSTSIGLELVKPKYNKLTQ